MTEKWESQVLDCYSVSSNEPVAIERAPNEAGRQGWELVAVTDRPAVLTTGNTSPQPPQMLLYLKRRVDER